MSEDDSEYSPESGRRADANDVIEKIYAKLEQIGINFAGDRPDGLNWNSETDRRMVLMKFESNTNADLNDALLPGFGEHGFGSNAKDDCGDPHPFVCDSCGHHVNFGRTCGRSICARCAVAWNRDIAIKKAAKVRRLRKEKDWHTADDEHQKLHHQIISPRLGWWYDLARAGYTLEEARKETKKIVKWILKQMRAQGVVIMHSYRGEKEDGTLATDIDENDIGEWKDRIYSGRDFYGDVRDELAWAPHYHCIVVSDYLKGAGFTDKIEPATGWVIHRIVRENDDGISVSLEKDGDMAKAITYAISHATIYVREDKHNRSAIWEVGSFQGDIFKSSSRFTAKPSDLEWADSKVKKYARNVLGIKPGTSECGTTIPPVDDPDELGRQILEQLYPDDDRRRDVEPDHVLHHVSKGNIKVNVTTSNGGGGNVTVTDAFGEPIPSGGWGGSVPDMPTTPGSNYAVVDKPETVDPIVNDKSDDNCDDSCGHDHGDDQDESQLEETNCEGTLIPLGEARDRGLLDDPEWCSCAAHVDEAREADREHPDDMERWNAADPIKRLAAG